MRTCMCMLSSNMHYTSCFMLLLHTFCTVMTNFPTYTFVHVHLHFHFLSCMYLSLSCHQYHHPNVTLGSKSGTKANIYKIVKHCPFHCPSAHVQVSRRVKQPSGIVGALWVHSYYQHSLENPSTHPCTTKRQRIILWFPRGCLGGQHNRHVISSL